MRKAEHGPDLELVLENLRERDLIDEDGEEKLTHYLDNRARLKPDPVFLRVLAGAGAWAAAVCFIAFLATADLLTSSSESLFSWGLVFLVAAAALKRFTRRTFTAQLSLAFISAGHMLIIGWAFETFGRRELLGLFLTQAVLTAVLYPLFNDSFYRFMAPALAVLLASVWLIDDHLVEFLHVLTYLQFITAGVILSGRIIFNPLKPLAYAFAAGGLGLIMTQTILGPEQISYWPTRVLTAASLILLFFWAAGREGRRPGEWLYIAAASTLILAFFTNPGIPAAVCLLVLGYAQGDRLVSLLGILFLPAFIVVFYYNLEVDLAYKSWVLILSGLIFLGARTLLASRPWASKNGEAAQ